MNGIPASISYLYCNKLYTATLEMSVKVRFDLQLYSCERIITNDTDNGPVQLDVMYAVHRSYDNAGSENLDN